MRDEDLTKDTSQGSINSQIFPLIPERFLSELPEPPPSLADRTGLRGRCGRNLRLDFCDVRALRCRAPHVQEGTAVPFLSAFELRNESDVWNRRCCWESFAGPVR
jgi:hypothetical protein